MVKLVPIYYRYFSMKPFEGLVLSQFQDYMNLLIVWLVQHKLFLLTFQWIQMI
jgi:hypothetical protein